MKYSCEDLQGSIYFGPNELRNCCQRFYVNGIRKGDVKITSVSGDSDLDVEKIKSEKKNIINDLNNNKPTPCDGCPKIQLRSWDEEIKIKKISMEAHSKCNARCSYCSEMFYGGLKPKYDIEKMFDNFKKHKFFNDLVAITWGGGEPVLLDKFDHFFEKFMSSEYPKFNDVRVYSNSIIFNKTIKKYLDEGRIILTTSTDAGTQKIFEKVRGVKKGFIKIFENLSKYNDNKNGNIIIKYILTNENHSKEEIDLFLNLIKEYDLVNCNFEISTDYKFENLDLKKSYSVIYFYNKLKDIGAQFIHFDDHVRKRLYLNLEKELSDKDLETNEIFKNLRNYFNKEIIVWGTGRYAQELVKKSFLFRKSKVAFFVDKFYNDEKNSFINNEVFNPQKIKDTNNPILIASSIYWKEIYNQIIDMGVKKDRVINTMII